jgi:hypothetical protein
MAAVNGVCAIIYEKTDEALFFLLFKRTGNWKGWESLKGKCLEGETPDSAINRIVSDRLKRFTIQGKINLKRSFKVGESDREYEVYLVESFTNIPVNMKEEKKKHDSYIWVPRPETMQKLKWPEETAIYEQAVALIKGKGITV